MKNVRKYIAIVVLTLTGVVLPALLQAIEFRNLTVNDGLSNRRVFSSAEDNKGFMWFATRVGIDKYDGETFTHYSFRGYNDVYKIRGILADRNGKIYAFTEKSFYSFSNRLNRFVKIPLTDPSGKEFLNTETIISVFFDKENSVWLGTTKGMLFSSDYKKWQYLATFSKDAVYSFCDDQNGDFWVGTSEGIYNMFKYASYQYHAKRVADLNLLNGVRIQSLYYDKQERKLWIGGFACGLYVYTQQAPMGITKLQKLLPSSSPIRSITDVASDNGPEIWAGTDGGGIFAFDKKNYALKERISQDPNSEGTIESNSIYYIQNSRNHIWISTYSAGIMMCNTNSVGYHTYRHQKDNPNSLYNNHVNAILEDQNHSVWFGTNSGISVFDPATQKWRHILTNQTKDEKVVILGLYELGDNIWAGGFASDIYCINKKSGAVRSITIKNPSNETAAKNYTYTLTSDQDGDLWLGGNLDELTCFNPKTGATKFYPIKGANRIVVLENNRIMVASIYGLYMIQKSTGFITRVDFSKTRYEGHYIAAFINSIYKDSHASNVVWLGSEGDGLYRYDLDTKKIRIYNAEQGISSNYVYGIMNDEFGRLWVSTENGLNCFNPKTEVNQTYFEQDGLTSNTFNFLAYTRLHNGNMIWGTPNGAVEIIPEQIRKVSLPINLRFTAFNLFYKDIIAGQEDSPLEDAIDDTKSITLKHNQNSFSFDFVDLNISDMPQIMYSWQLEGFDEGWTKPSRDHKAVYTNIPPGVYTFHVRAYKLGNRNEMVSRTIEVVVKYPFWRSPLAYVVYIILLIVLIRLINNFMKNRLEAKHSEEKIRFFVNMAHDVRTPITLVKAPLNELENETLSEDGQSALSTAQRNLDKLFGIVTQLLDFQKAESDSMKLLVEKTRINHFVRSVVDSYSMLSREKQIDLKLEVPVNECEVWIDRKKLSLCLENLISNAIKYTPAKGNIGIRMYVLENELCVEVSDDGIGIPAKEQKNLFNRFYRAENAANSKETGSGIGLMLTRKLILLHKGKIEFSSEEKIGTTFRFRVPCFEESYRTDEKITKEDRVLDMETSGTDEQLRKGVKLLLVEDNDEMRQYLSKQMRREYDVMEARDGNEALECIKNDPPDFVLSDIMMPGISGFELCATLKKRIETCHIPVILLSSLAERKDIITGFNAGADDYITKPFDLSILESKIKAILKNRVLFKKKYISKTAREDEFSSINELDKTFMEKVIRFIEENLTNEDFTIDNLAMEMAMSRSVFYKKLKSLTDENPKDLIKEIKMRKASELLREGKYPITEIAFLTGFPNAKYFSTAFKKYYGVSPSRFIDGTEDETDLDTDEETEE